MAPPLWQKVKKNKEPLDESERGEWKSWFKTQHSENEDHAIRSHHFMANRWWKQWLTLFFWAPKSLQMVIAAMKLRHLLLGRKNLDSILKSRDITLPTKIHLVKAMVFPVVMFGCESWTVKKTEHWRIDAFKLWCWRRVLRVPWTAGRSKQSILKEISPGCSLEGLMLKLKFPILWPPDAKSWLTWKDPDPGEDWRQEEKGTTEDEMVGWHHRRNGHELG